MSDRTSFLPRNQKHLIGMVHLLPLPGAPDYQGSMQEVIRRARTDAAALRSAGFDAIMIENFGDAPFAADSVPVETVAAMSVVCAAVASDLDRPIGINVLRNDAAAAIAIAAAIHARFIRVNVHTGAMLTDQGWITGRAHDTVRLRQRIAPELAICADVLVKHAIAPQGANAADLALDTVRRGKADVLIVSGAGTGSPTDPGRIEAIQIAVPDIPIWVGSGLNEENAATLLAIADGAIIGSSIKERGEVNAPVDPVRAKRLVERIRSL